MQAAVRDVEVKPAVGRYLLAVVTATREHKDVALGASPRGTLARALPHAAQARCRAGRAYACRVQTAVAAGPGRAGPRTPTSADPRSSLRRTRRGGSTRRRRTKPSGAGVKKVDVAALRLVRWTREGRVLLATTSAAALFALDLGRTEAHVLVLASASLLFASLLFTRGYRLAGVTLELRAPPRVSVGDEMAFAVSLRNDGTTEHRSIRIQPPRLPRDGSWSGTPAPIEKLVDGGQIRSVLRARFTTRGEHHMDPFRAVAVLPLGLSHGAPLRTSATRFVVVPKVARVLSVTTPRNRRHQPGGVARASRTGDATGAARVRPSID